MFIKTDENYPPWSVTDGGLTWPPRGRVRRLPTWPLACLTSMMEGKITADMTFSLPCPTSMIEGMEMADMTCGLPDLHDGGFWDDWHDLWLTWPPWWKVRRLPTWPVAGTGTERAAGESWPGHPPTDAERH